MEIKGTRDRRLEMQAEVCPYATNRSVEVDWSQKSEMICEGYNLLAATNHGALDK